MRIEYKNFFKKTLKKDKIILLGILMSIIKRKIAVLFVVKKYPKRAQIFKNSLKFDGSIDSHEFYKIDRNFVFKTPLIVQRYYPDIWSNIKMYSGGDDEIEMSLHRWYWLLYDQKDLTLLSLEQKVDLISEWIHQNPYNEGSSAWQSYTISERLSSFIISTLLNNSFIIVRHVVENNSLLLDHVIKCANHLKRNLEYYPDGNTFNHVTNNIKGLLITAVILKDTELCNDLLNLLEEELEIIFDDDGFLREGSSHYQLIVVRWLCELKYILIKSEISHVKISEKVHYIIDKAFQRVGFFLVIDKKTKKVSIPLIGDISPDFDPQWLTEYFSPDTINHYGRSIIQFLGIELETSYELTQIYEDYSRVVFMNWLIFVRHSKPSLFFPSHAHEDAGSFLLYFEGHQVIIDPGRVNYNRPHQEDYYCSSACHNGPIVNGLAGIQSGIYAYLPLHYISVNAIKKSVHQGIDETNFIIECESLKRLNGVNGSRFSRKFILKLEGVTIIDDIDAFGNIDYQLRITFPENIQIDYAKNRNVISLNSETFSLNLEGVNSFLIEKTSRSNAYHSSIDCFSVDTKMSSKIPFTNKLEIRVHNKHINELNDVSGSR